MRHAPRSRGAERSKAATVPAAERDRPAIDEADVHPPNLSFSEDGGVADLIPVDRFQTQRIFSSLQGSQTAEVRKETLSKIEAV